MNHPQYFRLMSGVNSFRSFFAQMPRAITVYLGIVLSLFVADAFITEFTTIDLKVLLAFSPFMVLKQYYIFQILTGSFVAFSFINLLSLIIFMIFFGFSYNSTHGNRHFINMLISHGLIMSATYLLVYSIAFLVLPLDLFIFKQFNALDLTHSLRIMLLMFWALDYWDHLLLPPIKIKHVLVLFLSLDVFYAFSHVSTGLIGPWVELSAIGWAYLFHRFRIPDRLDYMRFFSKQKIHNKGRNPNSRNHQPFGGMNNGRYNKNDSQHLNQAASQFLKLTPQHPVKSSNLDTNEKKSETSKKKPHLKIVK